MMLREFIVSSYKIKLMAKNIKNLELYYDNRSHPIAHQKAFRTDQNRCRPLDPNLWKIYTKMPRTHSFKPDERFEEQMAEDQKLIVISTFKNSEHSTSESPSKNFKNFRNQIKRYISDDGFNQSKKLTSQQNISRQGQTSNSCNPVENSVQIINCPESPTSPLDYNKSTQISLNKRTVVSGNYSQLKAKYRINRDINIKQNRAVLRTGSKIKLPQLKEEKKYPVLVKELDQLKQIRSESYILMEYPSERVLVGNRSSISLQIASLTKIMTYYTVMAFVKQKQIDITSQIITVSAQAFNIGGTSAELIEGEQYTIEDMLYGLMLPSGNDAANQLAYWMGSYLKDTQDPKALLKVFVSQMNKNARLLDLKNTKFGNPHGLPNQNARSTAAEMAKLCCICMKQDLFRAVVGCRLYKKTVKNGTTTREVEWENTNKLLRREGFLGIKTGITVTAGPCLATAYTFRDKTYISVVLRAQKVSARFKETRLLLHWALTKLNKDLTDDEKNTLKKLKKADHQLDSDYSEDEHEFRYNCGDASEYKRRCNILTYQM